MNEPESVDPDAQMDQRYVDLKLTEQIDVLFRMLKSVIVLLCQGRAYGLRVGLSPALAAMLQLRHQDDAALVLANTSRVEKSGVVNSPGHDGDFGFI
jgi:hypothetical protein